MKTKTTPKVITVIIVLALILSMASCAKPATTAEEFISQGDKYLASGDYDKAEAAYTSAIGINKKLTEAWLDRGDAYFGMGDYDSAIEDYEQALGLDDELVDAYIKLADCYVELDDVEEAIRWLQEGYDITESSKLLRKLEKLQGGGSAQGGKNAEVRGNTAGNITNFGFAAVDERGTLYVTYPSADEENWGSMRINNDGIVLVVGLYLNVVDGYIYFTDTEYISSIYKMRTDGSQLTTLADDGGRYLSVVDGWIYFAGEDDADIYDCAIYKMKTDGTGRKKLEFNMDNGDIVDANHLDLNVSDGWIYWFAGEYDAHENIYRMKTDGSATEKIEIGRYGWTVWEELIVEDGWMYYMEAETRFEYSNNAVFEIRRTRVDSSETEVIYSQSGTYDDIMNIMNMNIADGWIYCVGVQRSGGDENDFSVLRMKTDGTEITKSAGIYEPSRASWVISIAGGRIFKLQSDMEAIKITSFDMAGGDSEIVTIYKLDAPSEPTSPVLGPT